MVLLLHKTDFSQSAQAEYLFIFLLFSRRRHSYFLFFLRFHDSFIFIIISNPFLLLSSSPPFSGMIFQILCFKTYNQDIRRISNSANILIFSYNLIILKSNKCPSILIKIRDDGFFYFLFSIVINELF